MSSKCPACDSSNTKGFQYFSKLPVIFYPVSRPFLGKIAESELILDICLDCNHIYLVSVNKDILVEIYTKYYEFYPYENLESMVHIYRNPFTKVFHIFYNESFRKLLEVGCNSATQMQVFIEYGIECSAINPGGGGNTELVNFIDGFYGENRIFDSFDCIVSRFNLEHIEDINLFFSELKFNLKDEGMVFIQVPNNEFDMKHGILYPFVHEHTHYFSRDSLIKLSKKYGFQVLYISDRSSTSLICVIKKEIEEYDLEKVLSRNNKLMNDLVGVLNSTEGKIVLYGCGMSTSTLLSSKELESDTISRINIVDDNTVVHGRFEPNSKLEIYRFKDLENSKDLTVVLMLNEKYHKKVLDKVLRANCSVLALTSRGVIKIR